MKGGWAPVTLLVLVLTAGWADPASGQYLRCGGDLVTEEDHKLEVLKKCGEPDLKETRLKERTHRIFDPTRGRFREFSETVTVEAWTYNFGPHRFFYVVTFVDGKVAAIESPGYGF